MYLCCTLCVDWDMPLNNNYRRRFLYEKLDDSVFLRCGFDDGSV